MREEGGGALVCTGHKADGVAGYGPGVGGIEGAGVALGAHGTQAGRRGVEGARDRGRGRVGRSVRRAGRRGAGKRPGGGGGISGCSSLGIGWSVGKRRGVGRDEYAVRYYPVQGDGYAQGEEDSKSRQN